jgi:pyrroline-5-carboxylate reductase
MGQALALGWRRHLLDQDSIVTLDRNPDKRESFYHHSNITHYASLETLVSHCAPSAICLAVKPHQLDALLLEIAPLFESSSPLIMSVIAGKTTQNMAKNLWPNAAIIRTMPNTPSQIGQGMSGCFANEHCSQAHKEAVSALMQAAGECVWLKEENQMHALTAVSGSGPAYVFYLIETFMQAAMENGFDEKQARKLVAQTFNGAAQMVLQSELAVDELRRSVTSPNGTTQAGLEMLMSDDVQQRMRNVIKAAMSRSESLSSE